MELKRVRAVVGGFPLNSTTDVGNATLFVAGEGDHPTGIKRLVRLPDGSVFVDGERTSYLVGAGNIAWLEPKDPDALLSLLNPPSAPASTPAVAAKTPARSKK